MSAADQEPGSAPLPPPIFDQPPADEVAEELAFHLEMRTRELVAGGMDPASARQVAAARFEDLERVSAECHDIASQRNSGRRRSRLLTDLTQDIRFALRMLRRRPAFAALAVLTIGLGIGAATAIYSVVDGVMLRPLPFADPGRLVAVWTTEQRFREDATLKNMWDRIVLGQEEFDQIRDRSTTLRDMALWGRGRTMAETPDGVVPLPSLRVTSNLLTTLRMRPAMGRGFLPGEDVLNGPRIAMLSWEAWQGTWHGDSSLVGRSVVLDKVPYTVIGILPRGLRLDRAAPIAGVWTAAFTDSNDLAARHNRSYAGLARLAPGATLEQANLEVSSILSTAAIAARGPVDGRGIGARVETWQVDQTRTVRASLWILLGAAVMLLLVACVNVATLMLGEAARRQPEMAARVALGAGRLRIARQLLTESLAIALAGALVGCFVAAIGVRLLVSFAPAQIPGIGDVRLDLRVLTFATVAAIITGLIFGLAPTLFLLRHGELSTIRVGVGQTRRGSRAVQQGLVAAEIALSLVLLVGCTLLGRSLLRLTAIAPGFDADGLIAVQLSQDRAFWSSDDRMRQYYANGIRELSAIPGVSAVTAGTNVPFTVGASSSPVRSDVRTYGADERGGNAQQRPVLDNYFDVMGIRLLAGRQFNAGDREGSELVIIVSEAEARRDFPGVPAVGHRLFWQGKWRTVVGIVGDVKYAQLSRDDEPMIYVPFDQAPSGNTSFVLRASSDPQQLRQAITTRLRPLDPAVTLTSIDRLSDLIGKSYGEERYRVLLASLFGILASVLAAVGLYGVISRTVAQRMHEAGIRLALGASAPALTALMLRETLRGGLIGIAVGLAAAAAVGHLLEPYLFGVTARDPLAFAGAVALLTMATLVATLPAARRAGRTDPAVVLRGE